MSELLRRDLPHVMHETIDNEVVVVNLTTGAYYSFDGTGARIWSWIDGSRTAEALIHAAQASFGGDPDTIAAAVGAFVDQLRAEQLVAGTPGPDASAPAPSAAPDGSPLFVAPALQKYTDMEDLLLADPIHEVDEAAGWPKLK